MKQRLTHYSMVTSLGLALMSPMTADAMEYGDFTQMMHQAIVEDHAMPKSIEYVAMRNVRMTVPGIRGQLTEGNFAEVTQDDELHIRYLQVDAKHGRFTATLQATSEYNDFIPQGEVHVSGMYDELVSVPVLAEGKNRGDRIRETDITYSLVPAKKVKQLSVTSESMLIGKLAKRRLTPETLLTQRDVEAERLISKGDIVPVLYTTANMEVKIMGVALEHGVAGDVIRIRNDKSGVVIQARVSESGKALVNFRQAGSVASVGFARGRS